MKLIMKTVLLASVVAALGCAKERSNSIVVDGAEVAGLRPLSEEERVSDFDRVGQAVLDYYGPRSYKEKRFGYKVKDLISEYRQRVLQAKTDAEAFGLTKQFLTRLQDGHVSLTSIIGEGSVLAGYSVPIELEPVAGHALIAGVGDPTISKDLGIEVGDEVVAIDGVSPFELLTIVKKYETIGNEISDQHLLSATLSRRKYMTELIPKSPTVRLTIEKASGARMERTLVWNVDAGRSLLESERKFPGINALNFAYSPQAEQVAGSKDPEIPFFMSEAVKRDFSVTRVTPSEAALKAHGFKESKAPGLFAALLTSGGRRALLVRNSHYMVMGADAEAHIAWYKAVFAEYGPYVEALVIDQTRNPGGSILYAIDFVSLFANQQTRGLVNFFHPDRRWLQTFGSISIMKKGADKRDSEWTNVVDLAYKLVEDAYDRRLDLTEKPVPLFGYEYIKPQGESLKKPIVMLVDERSGSCGDLVPLLLKENKLATIFGERTMGLGGNVEPLLTLPNMAASLSLTRGLFTVLSPDGNYDFNKMTENNGVTPDVHYSHTVQDVRAGYVGYVKAFMDTAFAPKP